MARRRKQDEVAAIAAQIVGLVLLACMLSPNVRSILSAFGFFAILLLILACFSLATFIIYRCATQSRRILMAPDGVALARQTLAIPTSRTVPHADVRETTPENLLHRLRTVDWFQFEKVVALAYRKQGYTVTRRGGANPDGGIDLVISKDGATKAVQCKQWKTWNVGVKSVREFLGALTDAGVQRGIFITLRGYTLEAKQLADKHGIETLSAAHLASMLAATAARFDPELMEILGDTRKLCPKCEHELVLRTAGKGTGAGRQFWGCSTYPRCRFTLPVAA